MSTRRSRTPRARKARPSEAPQSAVLLAAPAPEAESGTHTLVPPRAADPTETGELRALEAGWDELLS